MRPAASCFIFSFGNYSHRCSFEIFQLPIARGCSVVFRGFQRWHFVPRSFGWCTRSTAQPWIICPAAPTALPFFFRPADGSCFCARSERLAPPSGSCFTFLPPFLGCWRFY